MVGICHKCGHPHAHAEGGEGIADICLGYAAKAMQKLLNLVGTPGVCRGCQASIFFVKHLNGANTPYDPSGLNHFVSCPKANDFKRAACRQPAK